MNIKDFLEQQVQKAADKCNQKEMEYLEAEKEFQALYSAYLTYKKLIDTKE